MRPANGNSKNFADTTLTMKSFQTSCEPLKILVIWTYSSDPGLPQQIDPKVSGPVNVYFAQKVPDN